MKKRYLFITAFLLVAAAFTSCEDLFDNCKICSLNTYENDVLINSAQEAEYCGTDLIAIEQTPPATVGSTTTRWECN